MPRSHHTGAPYHHPAPRDAAGVLTGASDDDEPCEDCDAGEIRWSGDDGDHVSSCATCKGTGYVVVVRR